MRSPSLPRPRPPLLVAAGVIYRDRRILVGQRRPSDRHPLKWEFPGGKVEAGESPQAALVRELREELSVEAEAGMELARYQHSYPNGSQVHLLFFAVLRFAGELEARVFEQIKWVSREELLALDFLDGDHDFVRRLARGDFESDLS